MSLFVTAIDEGSLSGAARILGLSLSSISRHLTALEERLGTRLVVRTTRMLALTEAGRLYYQQSKRLLAEIDEMEASLNTDAAAPIGTVKVSAPTLFGRVFILPILAKFLVQHPRIKLDVVLQNGPINLTEEGVDLAIRIGALEDSSLIARPLGAIRWVICGSPGYLDIKGEPLQIVDLSKHDCLVYCQNGALSEWPVWVEDRITRVRVPIRMRSNTLEGVVAAAVEGAGLVYAPAWSVAKHVAEGRLKVVLRKHEIPPHPIHAVFTHNRLLAGKVRALLEFLSDHLSRQNFDLVSMPERAFNQNEPNRPFSS